MRSVIGRQALPSATNSIDASAGGGASKMRKPAGESTHLHRDATPPQWPPEPQTNAPEGTKVGLQSCELPRSTPSPQPPDSHKMRHQGENHAQGKQRCVLPAILAMIDPNQRRHVHLRPCEGSRSSARATRHVAESMLAQDAPSALRRVHSCGQYFRPPTARHAITLTASNSATEPVAQTVGRMYRRHCEIAIVNSGCGGARLEG